MALGRVVVLGGRQPACVLCLALQHLALPSFFAMYSEDCYRKEQREDIAFGGII